MELERTPIISIRTGEAVKSVKELKQNIQDLKDKIIELRNAEQDCSKETLELQASQRELNAVNGLTKASTDAVAGSYADLLNQLKEARDAWKQIPQFIDGELNPAYTEATNKVRALTEQVGQMEQSTGDWHRNVGNYQSALDGFAGSAGKLAQGMSGIAGTFGIATQAGTPFGNMMSRLQNVVKLLNGASGILGMVKSMGQLNTATKTNTTVTQKDVVAHGANTVAKGAETVATNILRTAVEALKASVTLGFSLLLSFIPDVVAWFQTLGGVAQDATTDFNELLGSADRLAIGLSNLQKDDDFQLQLMRARKDSEEEIHEQHMKFLRQELETAKDNEATADRSLLIAQAHLAEAKEGTEEYENAKKAVENWTTALNNARDAQKKINEEIEQAPQLYEARQEGNARTEAEREAERRAQKAQQRAEEQLREARKEQAEADKTLLQLIQSQEKGAEKIQSKYAELFAKIEEYYRNGRYTQEQYNQAVSILWKQQNDELRLWYKERFETEQKGTDNSRKVLRRQEDEYTDVYKGLIKTLRGTVDAEKALYEENSKTRKERLEQDLETAREHLREVVSEQDKSRMVLFDFETSTREGLISMYTRMLADEDEFAKEFPEPFITALKTMGPLALQYNTETAEALKQHVNFLMKAYEQAVEEGDVNGAEAIRKAMLGDPPIADDEELTKACNDFIARFANKLEEAAKKQKPFYKWMSTYADALADLVGSVGDVWEELITTQVKYGKLSQENAKKQYAWVKGIRIAEATINTAQGVTAGIAKGAPVGWIEAATSLAAGTAQILKIINTDWSGSGAETSTSAPVALQPTPTVATVGLNVMDRMEEIQSNTRVYVVDHDIEDALNKNRVRIEESTF